MLVLFVPIFAAEAMDGDLRLGTFHMTNTAAFSEREGLRQPLPLGLKSRRVHLSAHDQNSITLTTQDTEFTLFRLENGLENISWDASNTDLLHVPDVLALSPQTTLADVPAWGATIAWPGLGETEMVLIDLGSGRYLGFLISQPAGATVVRQMEFRQLFGPTNRPASPSPAIPETN
ncbi:hypothetical protein SAMN06265374_3784 [Roseibium denhamense]|uniref:Uncharacterized protein n=3 Tax=Roseibium denhamense TaxID=76305 RepID=A0ABY1PGI0_9HYPH|nr:hypothetical protein SAMN06265374_3784 [Roseibium denhamense]